MKDLTHILCEKADVYNLELPHTLEGFLDMSFADVLMVFSWIHIANDKLTNLGCTKWYGCFIDIFWILCLLSLVSALLLELLLHLYAEVWLNRTDELLNVSVV